PRGPGASAAAAAPPGVLSRLWQRIFSKSPSYIDKDLFANAFMDIIKMSPAVPAAATATTPAAAITALKDAVTVADPQIKQLVNGIIDRTLGNTEQIKKEFAA